MRELEKRHGLSTAWPKTWSHQIGTPNSPAARRRQGAWTHFIIKQALSPFFHLNYFSHTIRSGEKFFQALILCLYKDGLPFDLQCPQTQACSQQLREEQRGPVGCGWEEGVHQGVHQGVRHWPGGQKSKVSDVSEMRPPLSKYHFCLLPVSQENPSLATPPWVPKSPLPTCSVPHLTLGPSFSFPHARQRSDRPLRGWEGIWGTAGGPVW